MIDTHKKKIVRDLRTLRSVSCNGLLALPSGPVPQPALKTGLLFPGHIQPAQFQEEDMRHLLDRRWSANWSEMGCFKTSTVCWLIPRWAERLETETPRVLIITTRSGKGTYFKHAPDLLQDYELFNVVTNDCRLVLGNHEFPTGIPEQLNKPALFVAHYNVFSRRKKKKKKEEKEEPKTDEELELEFEDEMEAMHQANISEEPEEDIDPMASMLADVIGEITEGMKEKTQKKPLLDEILKVHWDIIILDEAHRIKGATTGWTKQIKRLKGRVKHVMTGTGFINDPSEIWSLLHFCDRVRFGSYWKFRERYCAEAIIDGYRKIVGVNPETKDEFRELVREVGPRRTKKEVFKNLPDPIYSPMEVELNPTQRKIYNSIRDELYALDQKGEAIFSPNVLAALQRLRQVCVATPQVDRDYYDEVRERRVQEISLVEPSSKLDAVMEIIEGLEWDEERRDQVVIFSNFRGPIELAKKRFEPKYDINGRLVRKGIPYIEMKQSDNDRVRYQKWAIEFPKKEHQVFICTLQLGSESISLTSATTCIFLDRSWSPKDNSQGESRVWRPGQEEVANIIYINAKNTVDGRVLRKTNMKQGWFNEIFGDDM